MYLIGEDASSAFLEILKRLMDLSNTIAEGHYRRHANDVNIPKKPKVKIGELSKKDFKKLNEKFDMNFRHLAVPTEKLHDIENALKEMGGSYFVCKIEEGNNALIAVPEKQLDLANTAIKHVISDTLKNAPESLVVHDESEKLEEDIMKITSDILIDRDIPAYSFKSEDGKYINIVPDEFEGQYSSVLNEARKISERLKNVEITNFYQTDLLENIDYKIAEIPFDEAEKLYRAAKEYGIKADFVNNGKNVLVKYSKKDAEKLEKADAEFKRQLADAEDYLVNVTDNTITMNIETLLQSENEAEYFFRVPNTAGQDYIKLNKSDAILLDDKKTVSIKLDPNKEYAVFNQDGNIKSMRKGQKLAESYNTKSKYVNKDTEVYKYGSGLGRIEFYNKRKNKLISIALDSADNVRRLLREHGIEKSEADMLLKNVYERMPEEFREKFNYTAEKTEIVYADIPNIGELIGQAQLSEKIVGKFDCVGDISRSSDYKSCVTDLESGKYTVIGTMPKAAMIARIQEMGYDKLTAKQIADKILRDNPGFDSQDIENDEPRPKQIRFDTKNPQINDFSYMKTETGVLLVQDNKESYRCIDIDNGTEPSVIENILKKNIKMDSVSYAEMMRCLRDAGIINIIPSILKTKTEDISVSKLTDEFAEVSYKNRSVIINKDKINNNELSELGISKKGIESIKKSFEKSQELSEKKGKGKNLHELKDFAKNKFKSNKHQAKDKVSERIPIPQTGDVR